MMPLVERAASSTLFGSAPSQTYPPSQGSIFLYTDSSCYYPLSRKPTPLILSECQNTPISGIRAVEINSLPTCGDYGTPILLVSNQADCQNSSAGTGADSGVVGNCLAYSSGVDIGSMKFICNGSGISAAAASSTSSTTATSQPSEKDDDYDNDDDDDDDNDGGCECCCCCVVM